MGGLSATKHVVDKNWLQTCHDVNQLVPTSSYVLNERADAINNGDSLRKNGKRLLSDMALHRDIGRNGGNKPSYDELRELVVISGGEWVPTQRKASNVHSPNLLILMDDGDFLKSKHTNYIQTLLEKGATKIRWSDLRDCLLTQSLSSIIDVKEATPPKTKTRAQLFKETLGTLFTSPPRIMKETPKNGGEDHGAADANEEEAASSTEEGSRSQTDTKQDFADKAVNVVPTPSRDNLILVYSTELKYLHRNLSNVEGDQNRGEIGAGIMNIFKSSNIGLLTVQVFNSGGLQFQSEVPADFSGFFGNAGRENTLGWNAFDTSGKILSAGTAVKGNSKDSRQAQLRRFYFHFESREHLTCVLFTLFGSDDNARKLVEDFFRGDNRFCPETEPALPHRVIDPFRMDVESIDGEPLPLIQPPAPTSRLLFDNDPQEPSQII